MAIISSDTLPTPDPVPAAAGMMSLQELATLDRNCSTSNSVREAFGDSYLDAHNSLFRRVRHLFTSFGFTYSTDCTPSYRAYLAFPLLMIQEIIDTGVVPVVDTTGTVQWVLSKAPHLELSPAFLLSNFRRNYLLHESCHCVAYRVLSPLLSGIDIPKKQLYVLVSLLCEAYANSVERLAALIAQDDIHKLFYSLNSYIDAGRRDVLIRGCSQLLGMDTVLLLSIVVFLGLNRQFIWSEKAITALVNLWRTDGVSDSDALLMELFTERCALDLNKSFVANTTPLFFSYLNCAEEYQALCCQETVLDNATGGQIVKAISALVDLTCGNTECNAFANVAI